MSIPIPNDCLLVHNTFRLRRRRKKNGVESVDETEFRCNQRAAARAHHLSCAPRQSTTMHEPSTNAFASASLSIPGRNPFHLRCVLGPSRQCAQRSQKKRGEREGGRERENYTISNNQRNGNGHVIDPTKTNRIITFNIISL